MKKRQKPVDNKFSWVINSALQWTQQQLGGYLFSLLLIYAFKIKYKSKENVHSVPILRSVSGDNNIDCDWGCSIIIIIIIIITTIVYAEGLGT